MAKHLCTIIAGTGSYIPTRRILNSYFLDVDFYGPDKERIKHTKGDKKGQITPASEIIHKFWEITGIKERRYVTDDLVASDIGTFSATDCLESSEIDKETLKYMVFAHNFGDIKEDNKRSEFVPSLAARQKKRLKIVNPWTVAYDLPFGCPGWLEGVIQTSDRLSKGERASITGAETLSRISDRFDRDGMLYADGAGTTILEAIESDERVGILSHVTRSDTLNHAYMLWMDKSYNPNYRGNELFLKMHGHELYRYALQNVPGVVKESLGRAGLSLEDVKKILIHQANEKMDVAIVERLFKLYGKNPIKQDIQNIMPMIISWSGNSSVATLPTLLDLIFKRRLNNHNLKSGDVIVFASVGAGMNINSMVYRLP